MSFMNPQVYEDDYFEIETTHGTEIVPGDVIGRTCATHVEAFLNYLEGKPLDEDEEIEVRHGWLARMSAPGFLDCTEWTAHETRFDALVYLVDNYMEDTHEVLDVPTHFIGVLVYGDSSELSIAEEVNLAAFLHVNPSAHHIEADEDEGRWSPKDAMHVTSCICRIQR